MYLNWPALIALGAGLFLCVEDMRTKTVPLWGVLVFVGASLAEYQNWPSAVLIFSLTCFLYLYFFRLHKKRALGGIDIVLMSAAGFWFPLAAMPYFLMTVGGVSIVMALFSSEDKKLPLMPGIYLGAIVGYVLG